GKECKSFGMREFLAGGAVNPEGKQNKGLKVDGFPTSHPTAKKNDYYYYISAPVSPVEKKYDYYAYDWDADEQTIWQADFQTQQSKAIKSSTADKFPNRIKLSPEGKYLIYTMTQKKTTKYMGEFLNPFLSDSDLIIRNNQTGQEKVVLKGNYNRQLFTSFLDFSLKEDALFTIIRVGNSFQFVKIMLDSGEIIGFDKVFPEFNWNQINWDEFFVKKEGDETGDFYYPARFFLSPDETKLLVFKSSMGFDIEFCVNTATHKLWSINIPENTIDLYSDGSSWMA
ncbi:unnamed protein product, partial [marine sediment metagenome]